MGILDLGTVLPVALCLVAGYFLASTLYQWHRLRHIPGPSLASFSYLWLIHSDWTGKQYDIHKVLGEQYGPLVRIGPNEVSTDDPETIRRMSSAKSAYPRSGWYDGARFHPENDSIFTMVNPVLHDKQKAKASHGYSGRETPGLESAIDDQVANLISLIRRKYCARPDRRRVAPLDLAKVMSLLALDIISRIALGKEFGCLVADEDVVGFFHVLDHFMPIMNVLGDVPWARNIVFSPFCIKLIGPKPTDRSGVGLMMKKTNDEVRKRYTGDAKDLTDILGSFRRHGLTETECQTEALFMFAAGSETTASAMSITLFYIIATPTAYQRLKSEMKVAVEKGEVSSPITMAEAKRLPYLQAVLYEGMRMRPPATATFGKEVPKGGDTIHGHFVPGGTTVAPNVPSMMRSKILFGQDADIFRPERFLEASEDVRAEMQRNVELVFGYGRWMCAGKSIAWIEINKALFEVIRAFDFQMFNPKKGIISGAYGAWVDKDILVTATESDLFA